MQSTINKIYAKDTGSREARTRFAGDLSLAFFIGRSEMKFKDITGQRFNRLIVERKTEKRRNGKIVWFCKCDCGGSIETTSDHLGKHTNSCGCIRKEMLSKMSYRHGDGNQRNGTKTRLYQIWLNMKNRCNNHKTPMFYRYGGRGIKVCKKWNKFLAFKKWALRNGYNSNLTIDKIDNNKGYFPGNCQWITKNENSTKGNDETRRRKLLCT